MLAGSSFVFIDVLGVAAPRLRRDPRLDVGRLHRRHVLCRRLLPRHGLRGAVRRGAWFTLAGGLGMAGLSLAGVHTVWAILLPQYLYAIGHGMHQPCGQTGAIGPFPEKAGTAASLSGFAMTALGARRRPLARPPPRRHGLPADARRRRAQHRRRRGRVDARAAPRRARPRARAVAAAQPHDARAAALPAPASRRCGAHRRVDAAVRPADARCLCIAGPTASGKSAAALAIAERARARRRRRDRQRRLGARLSRHGHRHRQARRGRARRACRTT